MKVKEKYKLFREEIIKRDIGYLVHFTTSINLLSIYEQGYLYSRKQLSEIGEHNSILCLEDYVDYMDAKRLDNLIDYINLSIQSPNYFLLNAFRQRHDYIHYQWCVLKIIPDYIYENETLFSVCNAASISASKHGIDGSIQKFRQLFSTQLLIGNITRTRVRLPAKYPTDVQAEVLVKTVIPECDIIEIAFENEEICNSNKAAFHISGFDSSKFKVDSAIFTNKRI